MAPTGMATKAKKSSSSTNPPDFKKRIKAKVGKRAPKPANETDTSFQAASIKVNVQSTIGADAATSATTTLSSSSLLISSRGKSIYELINLVHNHPASAVRISAAKGLKDIITGGSTSSPSDNAELIRRNLSILLPSCIKCCTDTDPDVRDIGSVACLREIFIKLTKPNNDNVTVENTGTINTNNYGIVTNSSSGNQFKSFIQLLMAYVNAALNSLDSNIRRTGSNLVHIFATYIPDQLIPYVPNLLPPYIRLLSERSSSNSKTNSYNKGITATATMSNNKNSAKSSPFLDYGNNKATVDLMDQSINIGSMKKGDRNKRKRKRTNKNDNVDESVSKNKKKSISSAVADVSSSSHCFVDTTLISTLQSLAAVLKVLRYQNNNLDNSATTTFQKSSLQCFVDEQPDMIWKNNSGKSCNALLLVRKQPETSIQTIIIRSLYPDFITLFIDNDDNTRNDIDGTTRAVKDNDTQGTRNRQRLDSKTIYDLLCRIRDIFIEISTTSNNNGRDGLSQQYIDYIIPITKILRYFLTYYSNDIILSLPPTKSAQLVISSANDVDDNNNIAKRTKMIITKDMNRMKKLLIQLSNLVLECFPVVASDNQYNSIKSTVIDEANANLCITLQCIATVSMHCTDIYERKLWLETIGSFIQQSFEYDDETEEEDFCGESTVDNNDDCTTMERQQQNKKLQTSVSVLQVFEQLMLPADDLCNDRCLMMLEKDNTIRRSMIDTFCSVFFNRERPLNQGIACSAPARYAVQIAVSIFERCNYNVDEAIEAYGTAISDIPECIVRMLVNWNSSFLGETAMALNLLTNIVRRIPTSTQDDIPANDPTTTSCIINGQSLINAFRVGIEQLLVEREVDNPTESIGEKSTSILENLPSILQRQAICFIVFLEYPTEATLHNLGRICSRCRLRHHIHSRTIADAEASFIVQTIHTIRKTIPMQKYVGFLMDSTGLMHLESVSTLFTSDNELYDIDKGIRVVCSCLIECGTSRLLPKLEPLFTMFLNRNIGAESNKKNGLTMDYVCSRAILAILAMFSLDLSKRSSISGETSVFTFLSERFRTTVISAIIRALCHFNATSPSSCNYDPISSKRNRPVITLLVYENNLLFNVLETLASAVDDKATGSVEQANLLALMLLIVKNKQFTVPLIGCIDKILTEISRFRTLYKDGPMEEMSGRIIAQVELIRDMNSSTNCIS